MDRSLFRIVPIGAHAEDAALDPNHVRRGRPYAGPDGRLHDIKRHLRLQRLIPGSWINALQGKSLPAVPASRDNARMACHIEPGVYPKIVRCIP